MAKGVLHTLESVEEKGIAFEYCDNMDQKVLQYHTQYLRTKALP